MPFTFRKRIALIPGVLFLNLSRGEPSLTLKLWRWSINSPHPALVGRPAGARQLPLRRYPVNLTDIVGGDPLQFAGTAAGIALLVPVAGVAALQSLKAWRNRSGEWDYAGCCGCGRPVVNVVTVTVEDGVEQVDEGYCWACFHSSDILPTLDHIELDQVLFKVPWGDADRVFDEALHARKAGAR